MLYVVLRDSTIEEIPEATGVAGEDGSLACYDPQGHVIRQYKRDEVLVFGMDKRIKQLVEQFRLASG
jgi:hypothetical protein